MLLVEAINKTSSAKLQSEAYQLIIKARAIWQKAIEERNKEFLLSQEQLRRRIKKRDKDEDGVLLSPLLLTKNKTAEWYSIRQLTNTLRALQALEASLINSISVMNTPIPTEDTDELRFVIPVETGAEEEE